MCRKILREIVVLCLCLPIFPLAVILFAVHSESLSVGVAFLLRSVLSIGWGATGPSAAIMVRLIAPYVIVQCIRGFFWSQRTLTGKKWVSLYYGLLLAAVAAWSFWKAWDLFFFMYQLGDVPGEMAQFLALEGDNLLICLAAVVLGIHSFRIFLDPARSRRQAENEQSPQRNQE